jgi:hypothetical protein
VATVNHTWSFLSDASDGGSNLLVDEGLSSHLVFSWLSSDGSPAAGSVQCVGTTTVNDEHEQAAGAAAVESWENWGVPAGKTVRSVEVLSYNWKTPFLGTVHVRVINNSGNTVHSSGDLVIEDFSDIHPGWNAGTLFTGPQNVDSSHQASTTGVRLELEWKVPVSGTAVSSKIDEIVLRITYSDDYVENVGITVKAAEGETDHLAMIENVGLTIKASEGETDIKSPFLESVGLTVKASEGETDHANFLDQKSISTIAAEGETDHAAFLETRSVAIIGGPNGSGTLAGQESLGITIKATEGETDSKSGTLQENVGLTVIATEAGTDHAAFLDNRGVTAHATASSSDTANTEPPTFDFPGPFPGPSILRIAKWRDTVAAIWCGPSDASPGQYAIYFGYNRQPMLVMGQDSLGPEYKDSGVAITNGWISYELFTIPTNDRTSGGVGFLPDGRPFVTYHKKVSGAYFPKIIINSQGGAAGAWSAEATFPHDARINGVFLAQAQTWKWRAEYEVDSFGYLLNTKAWLSRMLPPLDGSAWTDEVDMTITLPTALAANDLDFDTYGAVFYNGNEFVLMFQTPSIYWLGLLRAPNPNDWSTAVRETIVQMPASAFIQESVFGAALNDGNLMCLLGQPVMYSDAHFAYLDPSHLTIYSPTPPNTHRKLTAVPTSQTPSMAGKRDYNIVSIKDAFIVAVAYPNSRGDTTAKIGHICSLDGGQTWLGG